jgi:hypothetical protein
MKTFKEFINEDGEVVATPANAVGIADKDSVAGEPHRKKGILLLKRNNKVQPKPVLAP